MKKFKKYKIDREASYNLYLKYKDIIKFKGCYDNVYNIVNQEVMLFNNDYADYKICYGAWSVDSNSNLYAKHCFFLKGDTVIDPTYFTITESDKEYIVFKKYSPKEYARLLVELNGDISLTHILNKVQLQLFESGSDIILIG